MNSRITARIAEVQKDFMTEEPKEPEPSTEPLDDDLILPDPSFSPDSHRDYLLDLYIDLLRERYGH